MVTHVVWTSVWPKKHPLAEKLKEREVLLPRDVVDAFGLLSVAARLRHAETVVPTQVLCASLSPRSNPCPLSRHYVS